MKSMYYTDGRIGGIMCNEQKVLVVDDNAELRSILCYGLDSYGFQVNFCESGTEALNLAMNVDFDYIITDYQMPQMNGIELTKRLRERSSRVVIIGMSADDLGIDFLNAGANDFLQKPFIPYRLAMMIDGGDILS
jgi:two-component system alkaline phosphatase synthesis response regulator PhoP